MEDLKEVTGATTLISAVGLNIWDMISSMPINGWFVIATSIGGIIYLYYKVQTQRKESKLKDLEITEKRLEIEKLKNK